MDFQGLIYNYIHKIDCSFFYFVTNNIVNKTPYFTGLELSPSSSLLPKHDVTAQLFALFFNTKLSKINENIMFQTLFKTHGNVNLPKHLTLDLHQGKLSVYSFTKHFACGKWEGVVGTGWSWLRIGTGGGHL